jgi:hypothetical protein
MPNTKLYRDLVSIPKRKPKRLYHYTSIKALQQILKSKKILSTKISYLNDHSEAIEGYKLAKEIIKRKIQLNADAKNTLTKHIGPSPGNEFIFSFTELEDDLSYWKYYGKNGCYISIDTNSLIEYGKQNEKYYFGKCIYDQFGKEKILNKYIDEYISEGDDEFPPYPINRVCNLLKNKSFREENEWRLISRLLSYRNSEIEFICSNGIITPRHSIHFKDFDTFPIKEICIGPSDQISQKRNEDSVKGMIFQYYQEDRGLYKKIKIKSSKVPFRS